MYKKRRNNNGSLSRRDGSRGFTLVELALVIIILGILMAVATGSVNGYQKGARDKEREADISVIARSLERHYRTQAVAIGSTYPPSSININELIRIVDSPESVAAPGQLNSSLRIASSSGSQSPSVSEYIYQPLRHDNSLCATQPCPKYRLYYRLEEGDTVLTRDSWRQQ